MRNKAQHPKKAISAIFFALMVLISVASCRQSESEVIYEKDEIPIHTEGETHEALPLSRVHVSFSELEIHPDAISYIEAANIVARYIENERGESVQNLVALVAYQNIATGFTTRRHEGHFWEVKISASLSAIGAFEIMYWSEVNALTGEPIRVLPHGSHGFFPGGQTIPWIGYTFEDMVGSENVFKLLGSYLDEEFGFYRTIDIVQTDTFAEARENSINLLCSETADIIPVPVVGLETGITRIIYYQTRIQEDGSQFAGFSIRVGAITYVGIHSREP